MKNGDLRVWWWTPHPSKAFYVPVRTLDEAELVCDVLAAYDAFQSENRIKPDYASAGGLQIYDDGEWYDWGSNDGRDFEEILEARLTPPRVSAADLENQNE